MSVDSIFAASRFGLEFERLRLEAASNNIAVANTPSTSVKAAHLMRAVAPAGFDSAIGDIGSSREPALVPMESTNREIHDPSDPMADKNGMVSYPKVDMVQEMSTLTEASRAYEANVKAFNTLRSMALHSLDIGGGS